MKLTIVCTGENEVAHDTDRISTIWLNGEEYTKIIRCEECARLEKLNVTVDGEQLTTYLCGGYPRRGTTLDGFCDRAERKI